MQRHFSNRGEALAEVTAARVLARRKAAGKLGIYCPSGRALCFRAMVLAPGGSDSSAKEKKAKTKREMSRQFC